MARRRPLPRSPGHRATAATVVLTAVLLPTRLPGQRPSVSPPLAGVLARDTTLAVWLFARSGVALDTAAGHVAVAGARVRTASRWLHAVSADATTAALRTLVRDHHFRHVQPLGRWRRPPSPSSEPFDERAASATDTCAAAGDPVYGPSEMPYRQLHLRPLTDAGTVTGAAVRVAILDAGFNTLDPAFAGVTVTAQHDFVFDDSIVRDESSDAPGAQFHGTAVWSLFAGRVTGRLLGIAPGASYLLAKTEDIRSETRVEEDNYVAALEWADSIGVDIVSSSLGYLRFDTGFSYTSAQLSGDVAVTSLAADSAVARGILVVTAAGNDGPAFRTLVTPGDARSVVTVGAEDSLGTIAAFSSRGPTADGRLKPDLTAPGVAVCAVAGGGVLARLDGTSFATPLLAASAALVKQLHPALGPIALRAALRASATNHTAPDSTRGWGRPDVSSAAVFASGVTPLAPLPPVLTTVTPDFSWATDPIPGFAQPVTYHLRVARDSTFSQPVLDTVLQAEQFAWRRPVKPGPPLFWQVDATAANGATASTGPVGPIGALAWARLTTLADSGGSATDELQPTFRWSPAAIASPPGPFRFDLFVHRTGSDPPSISVTGLSDTTIQLSTPLERNATYHWELVVHAGSDTSLVRPPAAFVVLDASAPPATLLYHNFPNPFPTPARDVTCIWFDLAVPAVVTLEILNLRGGVVRRLLPSPEFPQMLPAGRYGRGAAGASLCDDRLTWDGRADDGRTLPAGVYLFKLKAGGVIQFKRIVFRGRTP